MCKRGGDNVSAFSFSWCVYAKPMWLMDVSTWSSLNHMITLTECACCTWLVCCIIGLYCYFAWYLCLCPPYHRLHEFPWLFLPPYHRLHEFPWLFLLSFGRAKFCSLTFLWCCLQTIVLGVSNSLVLLAYKYPPITLMSFLSAYESFSQML